MRLVISGTAQNQDGPSLRPKKENCPSSSCSYKTMSQRGINIPVRIASSVL